MIRTEADITVEADGRWLFRDELITNRSILDYFKQNLQKDQDRFFVANRFGEKMEHSYLQAVNGFPLQVVAIVPDEEAQVWLLTLDHGGTERVPFSALYHVDEQTLVALLPGNLPARLSPLAMGSLAERMESTDPLVLSLSGQKIEVPKSSTAELLRGEI